MNQPPETVKYYTKQMHVRTVEVKSRWQRKKCKHAWRRICQDQPSFHTGWRSVCMKCGSQARWRC